MALLTKWAYRLMSSEVDLTTQVLKNNYGSWMDWERRMALARGASVFWLGLRRVFLQLWKSFRANLGDSSAICYRLDDWTMRGILNQELPYSFSLARNHQATVGACWDGTLSNLRVEDYLRMRNFVRLFLRQSQETQTFKKKIFLESLAECVLCTGAQEDCSHQFFECSFAEETWSSQPVSQADVSSDDAF